MKNRIQIKCNEEKDLPEMSKEDAMLIRALDEFIKCIAQIHDAIEIYKDIKMMKGEKHER